MVALTLLSILLCGLSSDYRGLLISEVSSGSNADWAELVFTDTSRQKIDISSLHVTMYYGASEPLSTDPVSIYSYDRPETPYDDRYVVVYPAKPGVADETDRTGDTNKNGILEVYCNNYYASFWNTDCAVSIDTDNISSNGGIIDFMVFSNNDGSFNDTVRNYMLSAFSGGAWNIQDPIQPEKSAVDIGIGGLEGYMSICRRGFADTNSAGDFFITKFQTPGRPNIESLSRARTKIFSAVKKRITVIPGDPTLSSARIPVSVYENCDIKIRIFSSTGRLIYQAPIARDVNPGSHTYYWNPAGVSSGLYICRIEASDKKRQVLENETVMIILSRYR